MEFNIVNIAINKLRPVLQVNIYFTVYGLYAIVGNSVFSDLSDIYFDRIVSPPEN